MEDRDTMATRRERSFGSVEQRMVQTYRETFPTFVPSERGPGAQAQAEFHRFMSGLYERLFDEPTLLFRALHPDDAYTQRFNKSADRKPELRDVMRKALKEVDALLDAWLALGRSGRLQRGALVVDPAPKIAAKHRRVMETVGLRLHVADGELRLDHDRGADLFAAWTWMASRPGATRLGFSRCLFKEEHPYALQIYAALSGDEAAYGRLVAHLAAHGYSCLQRLGEGIELDYVRPRGGTLPAKGGFLYGVRHVGISACYDAYVREPAVFGLRIPEMGKVLARFGDLEPALQDFVAERTKRCNGCRYCVQTNKTGERPLATVPVPHRGATLRLCPYFPGYSYCRTRLDDGVVTQWIGLLVFMERVFGD